MSVKQRKREIWRQEWAKFYGNKNVILCWKEPRSKSIFCEKNLREPDPTKIPRPNFIRIRNSADIRSDKSKPECGPFLRFKHSFDKSSKGSFVKRKIFVKKILSCTKMHFSVEEHINTIEQNVFLNFFNGFLCKSNLLF